MGPGGQQRGPFSTKGYHLGHLVMGTGRKPSSGACGISHAHSGASLPWEAEQHLPPGLRLCLWQLAKGRGHTGSSPTAMKSQAGGKGTCCKQTSSGAPSKVKTSACIPQPDAPNPVSHIGFCTKTMERKGFLHMMRVKEIQ